MAYYYRNRRYKKKKNNYAQPAKKLQMYCPKHGELIGYSNLYDSPVYESLNLEKNKVVLKCYQCLEEQIEPEREAYYSKYNEADKQANNKYGKIGNVFEKSSLVCFNLGLGGYFVFLYFWGWLEALVPSAFIILFGFLIAKKGESLQKQYFDYRTELTKDLKYVSDVRSIVIDEISKVSSWRIKQQKIKKEKMAYTLAEIDKMTGLQFEDFVKNLLEKSGYNNVKTTKASGDEGVDIIAYQSGKKIAIQCKRYKGKIGNSAVQQVYSGKDYYDCQDAYVITNSTFTENAINLAKKHKVKLIDRDQLFEMLEEVSESIHQGNMEYQAEFKF